MYRGNRTPQTTQSSQPYNTFIPTSDAYYEPRYLWMPVQPGGRTEADTHTAMLRSIDRGQARVTNNTTGRMPQNGVYWGMNVDRDGLAGGNNQVQRLMRDDISETRQYARDIDAERQRMMGNARRGREPVGNGNGNGNGRGNGNGYTNGYGNGYTNGNGRGNGYGSGRANGFGNGRGNGYTNGNGNRNGNMNGMGRATGNGNGFGNGFFNGFGNGNGRANGRGNGYTHGRGGRGNGRQHGNWYGHG